MPYFQNNQNGFAAFYLTLLVFAVVSAMTISISLSTMVQQRIVKDTTLSSQTYYGAEGGIEDAVYRIKKSKDISPEYTISLDKGLATVLVDSPDANSRVVTVLSTIGGISRKLETRLAVASINPEFFYGAQAGVLGIEMDNNSRIEGLEGAAGNVYSNGSIEGGNGAAITGDVFVASGMSEDQGHTVYNADQVFGKEYPIIDIAQSFKPAVSDNLVKISIYIKKISTPNDRTIRIVTDNAGSPSKTQLAWATLHSSQVSPSYGWVDVAFSSPPALSQGATYWLLFDASEDHHEYWSWGKDSDQGYDEGTAKYAPNWNDSYPAWTTITADLNFKTFMGGQITSLDNVAVNGDAHANTITDSKICGDAYYQTIDSYSGNFLQSPGTPTCSLPLTPGTAYPQSPDAPLQNMPISDSNINQFKQEAEAGGVLNGNLTVNVDMSYGPKKINGNLIVQDHDKTLTVTGTIYVTGYVDVGDESSIRCDSSYGESSCVVMADGWIHVENHGAFAGSGQADSYILLLSNSACDGDWDFPFPNCTHHNAAMDLHENVTGAVFYAANGLIYLHNNVDVSELTAKKIHLGENTIVRYGQGLANASFTSGPGASWQVESWKEIK